MTRQITSSNLIRVLALAAPGLIVSHAAEAQTLPLDDVHPAFVRAAELTAAEGGHLWGRSLDGPLIFVRREDRAAAANASAPGFVRNGDIWLGTLPDTLGIANTAFDWNDQRWTMVMWPLPDDPVQQDRLVAHELFHRIQDELGFPSTNPGNPHLDSRDGRWLLQMQWRALAAALASEGVDRLGHIAAALGFREDRHSLYPDAAESERALLLHEGLAQYTGLAAAVPDRSVRTTMAASDLREAEGSPSFVRSFAYAEGPAWGTLLDILKPGWRSRAAPSTDLPDMFGLQAAHALPQLYDDGSLAAFEDSLAAARAARLEENLDRYVRGPLLILPFGRMNIQFDPGRVETLNDVGSIYPGLTLRDDWGVLTADGGALIHSGWGSAAVPAPMDPHARRLVGEGYTLELADGWGLVPGKRGGDWRVEQR